MRQYLTKLINWTKIDYMNNESVKKISKINGDAIKLLMINSYFNEDILKLREKYGIEITSDYLTAEDRIISIGKYGELLSSIKRVLRKYKLTDNFLSSIKQYLLTNKIISIPASNYAIDLSDGVIKILVYQKPTKQEWVNIKKEVNHFLDLILKNKYTWLSEHLNYPYGAKVKRPKRNIDKNINILKRAKAGQSNNDIEFEIYDDENEIPNNKTISKNINKIRSIKRRYKDIIL
jgi:hypothetical protein